MSLHSKINRPFVESLLIFLGLTVFYFCLPYRLVGDAFDRYVVLGAIIEGENWEAAPGKSLANLAPEDKKPILRYSMVGPLFSVPLWYLGKLWRSPAYWITRFNFFLFAAGLFAFFLLLKKSAYRRTVRLFLLLLLSGSMFPNHLSSYFGEVFTTVCVSVGVVAALMGHQIFGWTLIILGVANTPACALGMLAIVAVQCISTRRWRYIMCLGLAAGLILLEGWIRRGSPFITGYEGDHGVKTVMPYSGLPGFSYPLFFGIISILFSFGKGLAFFAPGLFLSWGKPIASLSESLRRSHRMWLWFLMGMILVYSKWWSWYAGASWGPRFFLFASVPASLALAAALCQEGRDRSLPKLLFTLLVLTLSVWVGLNGVVFGTAFLPRGFALEHLSWYVPEFSVLWRPFTVPAHERWSVFFAGGHLHMKPVVLMAYFSTVYMYLAVPLYFELFRRVTEGGRRLVREQLNLKLWRF